MFSKLYDALMEDVDYGLIYQFIKPYITKEDIILDAGCGSGYLLLELLKRSHHAFGLDKSTEMLSLARDKLMLENLPVELYEHDLRDPFYIKVDVILMMFDVVNYFKGVKKLFKHVYQGLNHGGTFIFDIYKTSVLTEYHNYIETDIDPVKYTWHMTAHKTQLHHKVMIDHVKQDITQYVYALDYYLDILSLYGFSFDVKDGPDSRKYYIIAYKV